MKDNSTSEESHEEEINIRVILEKYLIHWKWFVLGFLVCLSVAYIKLRYSTPQYQAGMTILVKDEKKGGMMSELSAFSDIALGQGMYSNLENEIEILQSRTLIERTVRELQLNVSIYSKGQVRTVDLFRDSGINVDFINVKPSFYTEGMNWEFVALSANTFTLVTGASEKTVSDVLDAKKVYRYNEIIPTKNGDLMITRSSPIYYPIGSKAKPIFIKVSPIENVVDRFKGSLSVKPKSKSSTVVELSVTDANVKRAEVFLDNLVKIYNESAAADKNVISENTSKFIAKRLILITQELDGVEKDVEVFKTSNKLTDIESEAQLFIQGSFDYKQKSFDTEIQLNVVASMIDYMKKAKATDLLPSNLISDDGQGTSALIGEYNQLILSRNRILKSATTTNPTILKLDQQIIAMKANVFESLARLQASLTIENRKLLGQAGLLNTKIGKVPVQERQFRSISRQQQVKEQLYLYLLQKREETAISLAATAPNARVIDAAKGSDTPVSPKKNLIYVTALLLGLLIPFGILYLRDLLDTKVKSRLNITSKFSIPFLGDVPRSNTPNEIIDTKNRTSTAEAIRIVKSNLDFMLTQVPEGKAKSIFVTSTVPGEGKTFLSVNLAAVFAHSGKKVILVGLDIRKPKLNEYVGIANNRGLTDYISSKDTAVANFINKMTGFEAFDVLLGGVIPPNPTELLMNPKVDLLFAQLKEEYDYIIVDTAPVSLVSDTLIVAKHADTFTYVVRANYLDKRLLNIAGNLYKDKKLPNMAFVLNDMTVSKGYGYGGYGGYGYGGYGYGGYGYGVVYGYGADSDNEKKEPWYKKILLKFKK